MTYFIFFFGSILLFNIAAVIPAGSGVGLEPPLMVFSVLFIDGVKGGGIIASPVSAASTVVFSPSEVLTLTGLSEAGPGATEDTSFALPSGATSPNAGRTSSSWVALVFLPFPLPLPLDVEAGVTSGFSSGHLSFSGESAIL